MSRVTVAELEELREEGRQMPASVGDALRRALDELAEHRASRGGWEPPSSWAVVETDGTEAGWLAARERYLTASDAPAVLGLNSYRSRADIVARKADPALDPFVGNDRTVAGQCLEDGVCRYVEYKLGHPVARIRSPQGTSLLVAHRTIPGLAASPDGVLLTPEPDVLLEVKVTSSPTFNVEAATAQLRVAMACVGVARGVLAVCRGSDIRLRKVSEDPTLLRRLPAVVRKFWADVESTRTAQKSLAR